MSTAWIKQALPRGSQGAGSSGCRRSVALAELRDRREGVTPSRHFATLQGYGRPPEIRRDAAARRLRTGLEVSDPNRDDLPGDNWATKVARALAESEAMVVLLTPGSV